MLSKLRLTLISLILYVIFEAASSSSQPAFTLERFNLNQLFYSVNLTTSCRDVVTSTERSCYATHLDRYDGFEVKPADHSPIITEDPGSEFDRDVCCAIWRWHSCTGAGLRRKSCSTADRSNWSEYPYEENAVTYYCSGYEYGSYWCWPFPVWSYIIVAIVILLSLSFAIIAFIWYWRGSSKNDVTYYRKKRRAYV